MIVIVTRFIPFLLQQCPLFRQWLWLGKNILQDTGKRTRKSIYRCTCHQGVTEIMLKIALNTIQSILVFVFRQMLQSLKFCFMERVKDVENNEEMYQLHLYGVPVFQNVWKAINFYMVKKNQTPFLQFHVYPRSIFTNHSLEQSLSFS